MTHKSVNSYGVEEGYCSKGRLSNLIYFERCPTSLARLVVTNLIPTDTHQEVYAKFLIAFIRLYNNKIQTCFIGQTKWFLLQDFGKEGVLNPQRVEIRIELQMRSATICYLQLICQLSVSFFIHSMAIHTKKFNQTFPEYYPQCQF